MAGMTPSGSAGDDRSYAMGMHTEQLAGRTQQVFFRPEEGERFVYPWAPEVDYNKRADRAAGFRLYRWKGFRIAKQRERILNSRKKVIAY